MKRLLLKVTNAILAVLFINQVVTGLVHGMLSHEAYEILHERAGILLAVFGVLHVLLNWSWIKANYLPKGAAPKA